MRLETLQNYLGYLILAKGHAIQEILRSYHGYLILYNDGLEINCSLHTVHSLTQLRNSVHLSIHCVRDLILVFSQI